MSWHETNLGTVARLQRGFDLPSRLRRRGSIPIVSSSGVSGWHNHAMATAPGVVTGRYGTIGEVFFQEVDFWPLNTTLWVSNFYGNDERFVYYLLQRIDYATHSGKSGVPGVNRNDLHTETIVLPRSITEQATIADALEDADDLIATLERLIVKKQAIKQSMMQELLTGRTRLPGFTGDWIEAQVGDLVTLQVGFPFRSEHFSDTAPGIRLVRNRDLKSNNSIIYYQGSFSQLYVVYPGDILVGMDGDFAPCRWRSGVALLNQRVGRIRPTRCSAEFMYFALRQPLAELEAGTGATTVKHLSHKDIESLVMRLPGKNEQNAIAEVLLDIDGELHAIENRLSKFRAIKTGMMQQLLTGRTRLPVGPAS